MAVFDSRSIEKITDHAIQTLHLPFDNAHQSRDLLRRKFLIDRQNVRGDLQCANWIAKVMRDCGENRQLILILTRKRVGHLVKLLGDRPELFRTMLWTASVLAASREVPDRLPDLKNRLERNALHPHQDEDDPNDETGADNDANAIPEIIPPF